MLGTTFTLLFSFILVTTGKSVARDDGPKVKLTWPDKYTYEVKKLYIGSGLTEDCKVWYKKNASRIDCYNGFAKKIIFSNITWSNYGIKYDIHLATDKYEEVQVACQLTNGTKFNRQKVENFLPLLQFKSVRNETINDIPVVKFYTDYYGFQGIKGKLSLWAHYNNDIGAWIPFKYEQIVFNIWLGYLAEHEVSEFRNFATDFSDDVFNITNSINCTEDSSSDEDVTKHLLFINPEKDEHVDYIFNEFKTKYNRQYADERENAWRKRIFQQNMRFISSRNRHNLGYKLGINQFTDRTPEELKIHNGLLKRKNGAVGNIPFPYDEKKIKEISDTLPKEFDTRLLGLVSPVKNQHDCGSCWTFGATAAVEGALARKNGGRLISLSNQALIDCDWSNGNCGCDGGLDVVAYEWIMKYGLPTVEEYGGYLNKVGYCHIKNMTKTYRIRGFTSVLSNSVDGMKVALINHGPLAAGVSASEAFFAYSSGIFYDPECSLTALNHEVAIVGYGEENGETFWILKNSWGPTWGINGYMHIAARDNMCGVASAPNYPVV